MLHEFKKRVRGALSGTRSPANVANSISAESMSMSTRESGIFSVRIINAVNETSLRFVDIFILGKKYKALLDTGSAVSILPPIENVDARPADKRLCTASGEHLPSAGIAEVKFSMQGTWYEWPFHVCETIYPIVGADFLAAQNLSIEVKTGKVFSGSGSAVAQVDWLDDFAGIEVFDANQPSKLPAEAEHEIITEGPPIASRPRRLTRERHIQAKKHFDELVKLGVARPSKSPWASPLHIVPKKNSNEIRPCGDPGQGHVPPLPPCGRPC